MLLTSKVGVKGELLSKKSLSSKNFDQVTAFLLISCCLAFPKVQSSHGLKVPVNCIPIVLVVMQVRDLISKFNVEVIDMFLAKDSSRFHPFFYFFM